jgi:hypothetical protein
MVVDCHCTIIARQRFPIASAAAPMQSSSSERFIGFGISLEIVGDKWTFRDAISKTALTNSST